MELTLSGGLSMSLNPIAFGEHVVEQFQRYLLTYFPIADQRMAPAAPAT